MSLLNKYPTIDDEIKPRGNGCVIGDAGKVVQDRIIDMITFIASRYSLQYNEISWVLLMTKVESGYNPDAAAGTTSAAGISQATVGFASDAWKLPEIILGFKLDITGEKVFDAERGC